MSTSRWQLEMWFDAGMAKGATHMVVFTDAVDFRDYPVYLTVASGDEARAEVQKRTRRETNSPYEMVDRVTEVYHLGSSKEAQMAEYRAYNYEPLSA